MEGKIGSSKQDGRRTILLYMTYVNLFLAMVLTCMGIFGPRYPGHSGTIDNAYTHGEAYGDRRVTPQDTFLYHGNCPTGDVGTANNSLLHSAIIVGLVIWFTQPKPLRRNVTQVDWSRAALTFLGDIVCAFTYLCAFAIVMIDINYVGECCSLMEDNCEFSNLCTEFVSECCISDDVKTYCGHPSFHIGAAMIIFILFTSTVVMTTMGCTMVCIDLEDDLSRTRRNGRRGRRHQSTPSTSPTLSPPWSPRDEDVCISNEIKMEEGEGVGVDRSSGGCNTAMETREECDVRRKSI